MPCARLILLRLLRFTLRLRARALELGPGHVLIVAPHPDDETFGCGGLALLRRCEGSPVSVLFLTDGAASHPGHPVLAPAALATLRHDEAREAATCLGVADLAFLDLPDGRLPHLARAAHDSAVARLAEQLDRLRPATILVTHRRDGSSEHEAAFPLLADALARARVGTRPRVLEYPIWAAFSPRLFFQRLLLTPASVHRVAFPGLGQTKARAVAAYASQLEPIPPWTSPTLPHDFANAFSPEEEFFLEMPSMSSSPARPLLLARLLRRLRFQLHGHRAGLGQPIPAAALDQEYASGAWDHFFGPDELPRHQILLDLIRSAHPRPRLLDLGCGSGRLASLLDPFSLADYLGADVSEEGLRRARALARPAPLDRFERRDFEAWTPAPGDFNVITFNECLGYAPDPLRTARRFAATLPPDGALIVSHFRSTNHAEFWRRLARAFDFTVERVATNPKGQVWDLRVLRLRT